MKKTILINIAFLSLIPSCTNPNEPSQLEAKLDKIEKGNIDQSEIDDLLESMADQEGSYQVRFPKAHFIITFPVTNVKETSTKQIIDNQVVEIFHYTANMQHTDHVNLAYQLDYVFLPEIKSQEQIDVLFNEQRDYLLSATNAQLEFEQVITKNEAPGRHLYLTVDKSHIKTNYKMFFKKGVFYKLAVVTKEGKLFNAAISDFFDSFKITD